jgi:hypothetical protein
VRQVKHAVRGSISNDSPSPEAKPNLDWTTLVLVLLVLETPDSCKMFIVRTRMLSAQGSTHACTFDRDAGQTRKSEVIVPA